MKTCIFIESKLRGGLNSFLYNLISNSNEDKIEIICNKNFFIDSRIKNKIKLFRYNFSKDKNIFLSFYYCFNLYTLNFSRVF